MRSAAPGSVTRVQPSAPDAADQDAGKHQEDPDREDAGQDQVADDIHVGIRDGRDNAEQTERDQQQQGDPTEQQAADRDPVGPEPFGEQRMFGKVVHGTLLRDGFAVGFDNEF